MSVRSWLLEKALLCKFRRLSRDALRDRRSASKLRGMTLTVDIISIGALSRNVLWSEAAPIRAAHATTTLVRTGTSAILVDPSLPPDMIQHRLDERTGLKPSDIDAVFLTNLSPIHRRGLQLFDSATWLVSEVERESILGGLNELIGAGGSTGQSVSLEELENEIELLGRIDVAPDSLAENVDLFPSYGPTPGNSGLLVTGARTIAIAGDAVITRDYFEQRRVWDRSTDPEKAKESFIEIVDISDAIVPGHDNILFMG
jgi:glyoxylase-like metal-dependent hydrolase (beta-lactamase superfamily II)